MLDRGLGWNRLHHSLFGESREGDETSLETKGNMGLANLEEKKLLLEFDLKGEAMRVLQKGKRKFSSLRINLRRWKLDEGCSSNSKTPK